MSYQRSVGLMAKQAGRTIVRDPRKAAAARKARSVGAALQSRPDDNYPSAPVMPPPPPPPLERPRLPFEPSRRNEQTVGSTLASYALAGVAVSLGVGLVKIIFGA